MVSFCGSFTCVFSWWNVCIKASLCSSEVRPGLCCWTSRKSSRTTKENMRWDDWRRCHLESVRVVFDVFRPSLFPCLPENEAAGSHLLNRDKTDRLGRQPNLQEPHHVQGAVWSKVSAESSVSKLLSHIRVRLRVHWTPTSFCSFWPFLNAHLWLALSWNHRS